MLKVARNSLVCSTCTLLAAKRAGVVGGADAVGRLVMLRGAGRSAGLADAVVLCGTLNLELAWSTVPTARRANAVGDAIAPATDEEILLTRC